MDLGYFYGLLLCPDSVDVLLLQCVDPFARIFQLYKLLRLASSRFLLRSYTLFSDINGWFFQTLDFLSSWGDFLVSFFLAGFDSIFGLFSVCPTASLLFVTYPPILCHHPPLTVSSNTEGLVNMLSSIDEDRPTILRKLNTIEQKTNSILDRLPPNN
jgi:hypothetical protein